MSRRLNLDDFVAEKLAWHERVTNDPRISLSAKAVASSIMHDLNVAQGGAWRGQDGMSKRLGCSDRHLRRLLEELEKASYIEIKGRRGRGLTNLYSATFPDDAAVTEKRTLVSDQAPEKRTPASGQARENRTSVSRKPDTGVRQFPYDSIRKIPPSKSRRPIKGEGTPAQVDPFAQTDIRETVSRIVGEDATVSYLDPAVWDPDGYRIVCSSATGYTRLRELVGRPLAAKGVSIALRVRDAGQIAA